MQSMIRWEIPPKAFAESQCLRREWGRASANVVLQGTQQEGPCGLGFAAEAREPRRQEADLVLPPPATRKTCRNEGGRQIASLCLRFYFLLLSAIQDEQLQVNTFLFKPPAPLSLFAADKGMR